MAPALCSGYEGAQTGDLKLPTVGLGFGLFLSFGFQGEQVERNVPAPGAGGTSRPACAHWSIQCPQPRVVTLRPGPPAACRLSPPGSWKHSSLDPSSPYKGHDITKMPDPNTRARPGHSARRLENPAPSPFSTRTPGPHVLIPQPHPGGSVPSSPGAGHRT